MSFLSIISRTSRRSIRAVSSNITHFSCYSSCHSCSIAGRFDTSRRCVHQQSNSVSSGDSTSRTNDSWFSNIVKAVKNIIKGDDFVNPKKILERRYLYFALLATKYRELRLLESNSKADKDTLLDQAIDELDAKGLDKLSNVTLRSEMQRQLHRQVLDICKVFDQVDVSLNLIHPEDGNYNGDFFDTIDWSKMQKIVSTEIQNTEVELDKTDAENSRPFLRLKREALSKLQVFHGWDTATGTDTTNGIDVFGMDCANMATNKLETIRLYQTINMCRSALIREELGYSILCLKSLVPNAGRGVFIDGEAWSGSLIAFLPGDVWPKEHLVTNAPDVMQYFEDDDDDDQCQISLRFDDYVIDSRQSPVTVLTQPGSMNPFALGHMINHPPEKTFPNCQSQLLNYTESMASEHDVFVKYIPNSYARPITWQSQLFVLEPMIMHGMCLITRRDVKNEELFYDYRLQSGTIPQWYSAVQYGDDMDKEQQVFFRDDWMKK